MLPTRRLALGLALVVLAIAAGPLPGVSADTSPDFGVAIGESAPALVGVDARGEPRSLGEWLGKKPVVVLFYRSGDW